MRSKISSKLIFASAVCDTLDRAYYGLCVLIIKDIGRRLPLQLQQCSYQGQQGDVSQSVHAETINPVSVYGSCTKNYGRSFARVM